MKKYLLLSIALLSIQLNAQAQPTNDDCPGAKEMNINNNFKFDTQSNFNSTFSYENLSTCRQFDTWYKFTTLFPGDIDILVGTQSPNLSIKVYYASGFQCNNNHSQSEPAPITSTMGGGFYLHLNNVVVGTSFYVRLAYVNCVSTTPIGYGNESIQVYGSAVDRIANDNCTTAAFHYYNSIDNYNTVNAAGSTAPILPATGCNNDNNSGTADDDVFFKFRTPGVSGTTLDGTVIRAITTNGTDPVMFIYLDCSPNASPVYCSNTLGATETIWKKLLAGRDYYVRIYNYFNRNDLPNGRPMDFTLEVKDSAMATNDELCNGKVIGFNNPPTASTTSNASKSETPARPATCSTNSNGTPLATGSTGNETDVWFTFVYLPGAAANGMVVKVKSTNGKDPVFFLYTGNNCSTPVYSNCSNTGGPDEILRVRDITPGTTFHVRVHEFFNDVMNFTIQAKDTVFAVNDRCDGPIQIPFNSSLFNQNNDNTTGPIINQYPAGTANCSGLPSPFSYAEDDSWYRFTPTTTTAIVSIQSTNNTDPVLFVYDVNTAIDCRSGGATVRNCSNNGGVTSETLVLTGLTIGKEYFIRVYEQNQNFRMTFNIYAGNIILPVSLGSFTGEHAVNVNVLRWTTLTEVNNSSFELQRSTNGHDFETIASISSKATGGNSNTAINYDYTDRNPAPGINYYRLKQIDKDAKATYSSIVQLKGLVGKMLTLLGVYPNPASNAININISSPVQQPITLIVTDIAGKIVKQQTAALPAGEKTFSMDVQALGAGSYFIKAIRPDGCQSQYLRFNKN